VQPLGKKWLRILPDKKSDDPQPGAQQKLMKFQESAWKCFAYIALTVGSAYALSKETFWRNTDEFWTDCGELPCRYEASSEIRFAYALDMAYYMYAIPYCILCETKRKDFWATMSHHIVTVILIGYSYALGFTKVGVVIMFLHDICDSPLEMAKLAKYANREALTNAFFVFFTVLWIAMRVVYFPVWVIWSVIFIAKESVIGQDGVCWFPHWELFSGLLVFLWVLHVFWTYVILKIAVQAVSSGSADDTRED
jgi:hypothetical protein